MPTKLPCFIQFSHCIFHLCIPQGTDQGISHGWDDGLRHRHHLVYGVGGHRPDIQKHTRHKEHDDHSEVGATGGEGFMLPFRVAGLQGAEDDHIRSDEDEEDGHTHQPSVEDD